MEYAFKEAARIPAGVTADGVAEERQRIAVEYGKPSVKLATSAVLSEPDRFPNLRAFGAPDSETALEQSIERGIRYAFANVIRVTVRMEPETTQTIIRPQVRAWHLVPDQNGDMIYEDLAIVAQTKPQRDYLLGQLQKDVDTFARKLKDVIAEISALS